MVLPLPADVTSYTMKKANPNNQSSLPAIKVEWMELPTRKRARLLSHSLWKCGLDDLLDD